MILGIRIQFPEIAPNIRVTVKPVYLNPQRALTLEQGIILFWKKELKTLDYFSCEFLHDLGVFMPFFPKLH